MKNKNLQLLLGLSVILIIIIFNTFRLKKEKKELIDGHLITIEKVIDKDFTGKVYGIKYCYFVDSNYFVGTKRTPEGHKYINNFFVLKYSKKNHEISEINLEKQIYDSLEIVKAGFKLQN